MPIADGSNDVRANLSDYTHKLANYERAHDEWAKNKNASHAAIVRHAKDKANYLKNIVAWNVYRSFGHCNGGRPVNPGLAPEPFRGAEPVRPQAPKGLHHKVYENRDGQLPPARKGFSYHEAQVSQARGGERGQHRIVCLVDDSTGRVVNSFSTIDHYGDNKKSKDKPSFTRFE